MTSPLFVPTHIQTSMIISMNEISKVYPNGSSQSDLINNLLLYKLKNSVGNKCIKEGFIEKDSIEIIHRTLGKVATKELKGNIRYNILYSANVCHPVRGDVIKCKIVNINKMGILAENNPLSVVIARQHHPNKKIFSTLEIGDELDISIIGIRYNLFDYEIRAIGLLNNFEKNLEL